MLLLFRWMLVVAVVQFCSCALGSSSFANININAFKNKGSAKNSAPVRLIEEKGKVTVDNGISSVTLTTPDGTIVGIKYGGIDNLLFNNRRGYGYWDVNWQRPDQGAVYTRLSGTVYSVPIKTDDQVELSFLHKPDSKDPNSFPFGFDLRFVMLRGVDGFYCYAIYERPQGAPDLDLHQTRVVFKLNPDKFKYMALSDKRRRVMPSAEDRSRGRPLAYKEAALLTNPTNPELRGTVDDKYMYSAENQEIKVHGWISMNPGVGFWVITPSYEFVGGGPMKQDLTSHVGPVSLAMFVSTHYAGVDITARFRRGEPWKKVFGPVFIYLNSNNKDPMTLWDDAKRQMSEEVGKWPYTFPMSTDFHPPSKRGAVSGELVVQERYGTSKLNGTSNSMKAYVGLALPGAATSWETDNKGYQFWVQADEQGRFQIQNVVPGTYNLYAWVQGYLGEYVSENTISITPGGNINLGQINFHALSEGPKLWEIGIPDRNAAEFYIPEPDPNLTSGLYSKNHFDLFREYGLWDRYSELYPKEDPTFNADHDKYQTNWFYAHVNRKGNGGTYLATTRKIIFSLKNVSPNGVYKLWVALASASMAELQVRINKDPSTGSEPDFRTMRIGRDNAIARHGSHGLYSLFNITIPGGKLVKGQNTFYLTQSRTVGGPFTGIMYDYIRFESPA